MRGGVAYLGHDLPNHIFTLNSFPCVFAFAWPWLACCLNLPSIRWLPAPVRGEGRPVNAHGLITARWRDGRLDRQGERRNQWILEKEQITIFGWDSLKKRMTWVKRWKLKTWVLSGIFCLIKDVKIYQSFCWQLHWVILNRPWRVPATRPRLFFPNRTGPRIFFRISGFRVAALYAIISQGFLA